MTANPEQEPYDGYDEDEQDSPKSIVGVVLGGFSFVWFQRKVIFGLLLAVGVGYVIYRVYSIPPETFDVETNPVAKTVDVPVDLPSTDPVAKAVDVPVDLPSTDINFQPVLRTMDDIPLPEKKTVEVYDPILDGGNIDLMIEEALNLRQQWLAKSPPIQYLMSQRRAQIAKKLMGMSLSENQRVFAVGDYIESVILLDNIVLEQNYDAPMIRDAMNEIVSLYSDNEHPVICAKANLAAVLIPVHEFIGDTTSDQHLADFVKVIPERIEKIVLDEASTHRLAGLMLLIHKRRNWDGTALPYCMEVVRRLEQNPNERINKLGNSLRERLFFQHLEPEVLIERISLDDDESRKNVQQYFEALDQNPNVKLKFFQLAVSAIEKFKVLNKEKDYNALIDWLRRITKKVHSEDSRKELYSIIEELDALPFGPRKETPAKIEN